MSQEQALNSNWDLPYHDILIIDNVEGQDPVAGSYEVGQNNVDAHGDQKKCFVSKHTFLVSVVEETVLRLNDSRNVDIADYLSGEWLLTNISRVYYVIPAGGVLVIYFEGVLPEEARDAH
jgi:hypothetical protein